MRTYTIELRCDFDDESRYGVILDAIKMEAKALLTTASLIQDNRRKPQIAVSGGDFFFGTEDISLVDDGEEGSDVSAELLAGATEGV